MAVINDFYWASHKCLFVITGSHFFVVWRNRRGTNLDTKAQVSSGINGCEWTKEGLPWQKILTLCNLICLGSNTLKAEFKATSQEKISSNPASASKAASEPDSQGWAKWLLRSSCKMFQDCVVSRERSIRCCNFRLTPGHCSAAGCGHYNGKMMTIHDLVHTIMNQLRTICQCWQTRRIQWPAASFLRPDSPTVLLVGRWVNVVTTTCISSWLSSRSSTSWL